MKFIKKYGLIIIAVGIIGGILYLNRFSSVSKAEKGKELYKQHCTNCHGEKGEGLKKLIPPLAGSDYAIQHFNDIPCIIRYGMRGEIHVNKQSYNQPMAGIPTLEADEIKAIMDFMVDQWYHELEKPSHGNVADKLEKCAE